MVNIQHLSQRLIRFLDSSYIAPCASSSCKITLLESPKYGELITSCHQAQEPMFNTKCGHKYGRVTSPSTAISGVIYLADCRRLVNGNDLFSFSSWTLARDIKTGRNPRAETVSSLGTRLRQQRCKGALSPNFSFNILNELDLPARSEIGCRFCRVTENVENNPLHWTRVWMLNKITN